jgi:ABC-type phosphate transport system permease subunit
MIRVVLVNGAPGIAGAVILGLGRALGETMAVTMVIGNRRRSVFRSSNRLTRSPLRLRTNSPKRLGIFI